MDELESVKDKDAEKRVQANMAKGKFTFRDLYTKFESMSKMGSLSKVMGMMPGMSGEFEERREESRPTLF